ncbi:MAG TPA: glucose-6-phosphate dehydrogenase assembly protein OpcA [Gaiellaceae bacterium]
METALASVGEIEHELASLRSAEESAARLRTSVMTHIAWVPEEWVEAAEDVLSGLAERHPSRTIVLLPQSGEGGLEGGVSLECFRTGESRMVCTETIRIRLHGTSAEHPASVVEPLLITDLPVFLRWRGSPPFGSAPFEELVEVVDRLIIDSAEWPDLPRAYAQLAEEFERVTVSDIAWARTSRWRPMLASLWPEIAELKRIKVTGTAAQAHLLAGWLSSRLERPVELEHEPAAKLVGVEIDGEPAPFPPSDPPLPADLLSDELERLARDPIYEAAVRAAVT